MKTSITTRAAIASVLVVAAPLAAAPGDPLGPEYRVHEDASGAQVLPAVAMSAAGRAFTLHAAESGVHGRYQFANSYPGAPASVLLAGGDGAVRTFPAVTMSKYGIALGAWTREAAGGPQQVFLHQWRYDNEPMGSEFALAPDPGAQQHYPAVATDFFGSQYAVVWTQTRTGAAAAEVHLRMLDSSLAVTSTHVVGPMYTTFPQAAAVSMNDEGYAVVAWAAPDELPASAYMTVQAQVYLGGEALGAPLVVAAESAADRMDGSVAVAMREDGGYVVAWWQDHGIRARIVAPNGTPGAEFDVSTRDYALPDSRRNPAIATQLDGGFVVVWSANDSTTEGRDVFARRFAADGSALSGESRVNTLTIGDQFWPRVARDADGDTLITWTSDAQDGNDYDAYEIRLQGERAVDLAVTIPTVAPVQPIEHFDAQVRIANFEPMPDWSNEGVGASSGMQVEIGLSPGLTFVGAGGAHWSCTEAPPLYCTFEHLVEAGLEAYPLTVNLMAPHAAGEATITARVLAHQSDSVPGNNETSTVVQVIDDVPDAFSFGPEIGAVARSAQQVSPAALLSGFSSAAPVTVAAGEYSVNGGPFTASSGYVYPGDSVRVRHVSSAAFSTRTTTSLGVSGVFAQFSTVTEARDVAPDAFAFADAVDVARGSTIVSSEVAVGGINDAAAISVAGGEYSIDGGVFTDSAGTIGNAQRVRVRHVSPAAYSAATNTTLTIGGVSDTFTSTTVAEDTQPDPFAFAAATNVATRTLVISNAIVVAGTNAPATIAVTGGEYSLNGSQFTGVGGVANAGDSLRVRVTSADIANAQRSVILTIGGVSGVFTATTGSVDSTPNAFSFTDLTRVKRNKPVTSGPITISGINTSVPITVSGFDARWSKNGGAFTSAPGTVANGDAIRVQVTAPSTTNTPRQITVTIGGVVDTWRVTTGAH